MSKHTKINQKVKSAVWERDEGRCIVCGNSYAMPNSHVVRRSQGGRGIPENIVTHCGECHRLYDSYDEATVSATIEYIKRRYPGWSREGVTYRRYGEDGLKNE